MTETKKTDGEVLVEAFMASLKTIAGISRDFREFVTTSERIFNRQAIGMTTDEFSRALTVVGADLD